jgi:hypothetical protein
VSDAYIVGTKTLEPLLQPLDRIYDFAKRTDVRQFLSYGGRGLSYLFFLCRQHDSKFPQEPRGLAPRIFKAK